MAGLTFASAAAHRDWLAQQAALPAGFRVGTATFEFTPKEAPRPASMTVTVLACDEPTPDFAAVYTRNALPGAPVVLGRARLAEPTVGAVVVNNRISNVCAPQGLANAERTCAAAAAALGIEARQVLVSSTGVIGWDLPIDAMEAAIPRAVAGLQADSVLAAATGIMTTDRYPKVRRVDLPSGGAVVGIAKGAGMIEPDLATMLVYLLTDVAVPRQVLRACLSAAMESSFNAISIDTDTSTSDAVVALSSGRVTGADPAAFAAAVEQVCQSLAGDVVRNGEGVRHVIRCAVTGAPSDEVARGVAKAVINSPLVKTAVAGNDANAGRLAMAVGKYVGRHHPGLDLSGCRLAVGGEPILKDGAFLLDPAKDARLHAYLQRQELGAGAGPDEAGPLRPPLAYPPHEGCVEIDVDLGCGTASFTATGADLTPEYVSENADYRS